MKIINFKKQKMKLLTNEQQESHENVKICYICKEKIEHKYVKDKKNIVKLEIIAIMAYLIYTAAHISFSRKK